MRNGPLKFVALPTKGEAFLLRRETRNILIDSGSNGRMLANLLSKQFPKLKSIDIAVCTHAHQDHANGFKTLIKEWQSIDKHAKIRQYWLPGCWFQIVLDLINDPDEFVDSVISDMEEFAISHSEVDSESDIDDGLLEDFERLPENPVPDESPREGDETDSVKPPYDREFDDDSFDDIGEQPWMKNIPDHRKQVDYQDTEGARAIRSAQRQIRERISNGEVSEVIGRYWLDLIITADVIRQIANLGIGHKATIRWFDYGGFDDKGWELGGVHGLLIPINSVEQVKPSLDYTSKSRQLRLCAVNERCLSFYSPGNWFRLGVLFCGDSPMGHGRGYSTPFVIPQQSKIPFVIATAPHHGSQTNARAYTYILKQIQTMPVVWVRSGGKKMHPGNAYRSIPPCLRLCSSCPLYDINVRYEASIMLPRCGFPITVTGYPCRCRFDFGSKCVISRQVRHLAISGYLAW